MCRQTPCDNRCPNASNSWGIVGWCEECGGSICSMDIYWTDKERYKFCSRECAEDFYGIKEVDE